MSPGSLTRPSALRKPHVQLKTHLRILWLWPAWLCGRVRCVRRLCSVIGIPTTQYRTMARE